MPTENGEVKRGVRVEGERKFFRYILKSIERRSLAIGNKPAESHRVFGWKRKTSADYERRS